MVRVRHWLPQKPGWSFRRVTSPLSETWLMRQARGRSRRRKQILILIARMSFDAARSFPKWTGLPGRRGGPVRMRDANNFRRADGDNPGARLHTSRRDRY